MELSDHDLKQKAAFQKSLTEDPYDATTHLVYADWLDEHDLTEEAQIQRAWTVESHLAAEAFMQEYLDALGHAEHEQRGSRRLSALTVADLLAMARTYLDSDGTERAYLSFVTPDFVYERAEAFWKHFQVLTGLPVVKVSGEIMFRCGC